MFINFTLFWTIKTLEMKRIELENTNRDFSSANDETEQAIKWDWRI